MADHQQSLTFGSSVPAVPCDKKLRDIARPGRPPIRQRCKKAFFQVRRQKREAFALVPVTKGMTFLSVPHVNPATKE
jgi:hypothetical protein